MMTAPKHPPPCWSETLLGTLRGYQQSQLYCDMSIESGNGVVYDGHMCVVAAACPVLCPLVASSGSSYRTKVPLSDSDLDCVLDYIYTGQLKNGHEYESSIAALQEMGISYMPASRWCDHLTECLQQFQKAQLFGNVTLVTSQGDSIAAHACVLASSSPVFADLLSQTSPGIVTMETDISSSTLQFLLAYLYTGRMQKVQNYIAEVADGGAELGAVFAEFVVPQRERPTTACTISQGKGKGKGKGKAKNPGSVNSNRTKHSKKQPPTQVPITYPCSMCKKVFRMAQSLEVHKQKHHPCSMCPKVFRKALCLEVHERKHTGIKPCACPQCGKKFTTDAGVKGHIERMHEARLPQSHVCEICGKAYSDSQTLRRHIWKHTDVDKKRFMCKECGKVLAYFGSLKAHEAIHSGLKTLLCQFCGKAFRATSNLHAHERVHTGEKPFVCRFCGKSFNVACSLRRHERLHTGDKPYCCKQCPAAFAQLTSLKNHMQKHGRAKYFCQICRQAFVRKYDLTQHMNHNHNNEEWHGTGQ